MENTDNTGVIGNVAEMKFRANSDHKADWVNGKLHFWFRDGTVKVFDPALVSRDNRTQAEFHGWDQRLGDSMAVEIEKYPNKADRDAEKKRRLTALIEHYHSGSPDWNIKRAAAGPRDNRGIIVQALMQHFGCDLDGVERRLTVGMTKRACTRDDLLDSMATIPAISQIIAELKAKRVATKIDVAGLLDELAEEE